MIALVISAVVAGYLYLQWSPPNNWIATLHSERLQLRVSDVDIQNVDGYFNLGLEGDLFLGRSQKAEIQISNNDIMGLCGDALTHLEDFGAEFPRQDVFRLTFSMKHPETGKQVGNVLPVHIADGACWVKNDRSHFFPRSPPPLQDWEIRRFKQVTDAGGARFDIEFLWRGEGDPNFQGFDFRLACKGVLADPPRGLEELLTQNNANAIRIRALSGLDSLFFKATRGYSATFKSVGNVCLEELSREDA